MDIAVRLSDRRVVAIDPDPPRRVATTEITAAISAAFNHVTPDQRPSVIQLSSLVTSSPGDERLVTLTPAGELEGGLSVTQGTQPGLAGRALTRRL